VAIAFTPFVLLMLGVQIGLDVLLRRQEKVERSATGWAGTAAPATAVRA
jgi:hypothetical protein